MSSIDLLASPQVKRQMIRWVRVTGAFKLDHLYHFKPILLLEFSIWFTFILGGQFLFTPEG